MAPIIIELKKSDFFDVYVLVTAQHRSMLDQVLNIFCIKPDFDLDVMQSNQSLTMLTSRILAGLDDVLFNLKPDIVLAQGDTTSVMATAMACFYHRIHFGHVEAGLRTWDLNNPFPEEMNRVFSGILATWHFAPTEISRLNLIKEGIADDAITVTGNSVIDALMMVKDMDIDLPITIPEGVRLILVTAHRRENFGEPFKQICRAILLLLEKNPDIHFLYPVHPNPNISGVVHEIFNDNERVTLCGPLEYLPFVAAMKKSYLILTDSGGVQEEAPVLAKPVLVLRHETERPEAVEAGMVKLVGTSTENIVRETQKLLDSTIEYKKMALGASPYGDGMSSRRISDVLHRFYQAY